MDAPRVGLKVLNDYFQQGRRQVYMTKDQVEYLRSTLDDKHLVNLQKHIENCVPPARRATCVLLIRGRNEVHLSDKTSITSEWLKNRNARIAEEKRARKAVAT